MMYPVLEAPSLGARRLRLLIGALLSVCVLGLVAAQHAAAASWPYAQSASALGFPSNALSPASWDLNDTACATTDSCVVVGDYEDTSTNTQADVQPITDGAPGPAVQVTLPANADTSSQDASLEGVACQSANTCEAYGYYDDSSDVQQPMVVQITDGVPATAVEVTAPANSLSGADVTLNDITCASSSSCVAVGYYETTTTLELALVVPISSGVPGTPAVPSLPADSYTTPDSALSSVACQASGSCAAVGYFYNTADDETALEVPITNGDTGAGVETLPADVRTSDPGASLSYVACPVSGACEAIGYYYNSSGDEENMVVPITAGAPGTATAATPPPNHASGYSYVYLDGLGCSSASLCTAAGYYYYISSSYYMAALTLITSSGATSQAASVPSDASTTYPDSEFEGGDAGAVGCMPSGPCLATGWYYTKYGGGDAYSGLAQQVSASGQAGTSLATPVPADSYEPQYAYLYGGTACDTAGSCVATGEYYSFVTDAYLPYEVTEQSPLSVTTTSLPGAKESSHYQSTLAATGAWGSYTWSVSSGSLPAGLRLDSQTGVISGTPPGSGTSTFTVQVTGTGGSPVPTATQSLSLTVAAVAPVVRVLRHSGLVRSDRLGVKVGCSRAPCSGTVKLDVRELVIVKHGNKRVRKHRTVVIGSAHYSLTVGATKVVKVKLNGAGRSALAKAKRHHVAIKIIATVKRGKQASRHETIWTVSKKKK